MCVFILGKNPALSTAEILALGFRVKEGGDEAVVSEGDIKVEKIQKQLGGSIKIGRVMKVSRLDKHVFNNQMLTRALVDVIPAIRDKKIYFGLSLYNAGGNNQVVKKLRKQARDFGKIIKELLKEKGISSRWVTSREPTLSSVVVKTNKLLSERGREILLLIGENKIYLGETVSVQEFEEYSFRDYGRPASQPKSGMIPPKLAKIMINLAQAPEDGIILDPFCGAGTILGEAMMLGYRNLLGSDINWRAVEDTKKNLGWLLSKNSKFQIPNYKQILPLRGMVRRTTNSKFKIQNCDTRRLAECFERNSVNAIVTEPYLGPPDWHGANSKWQIVIKELEELYLGAFKEFGKVLKPKGRVIIVFPFFGTIKKGLDILDRIKDLGFKVEPLLPPEIAKNFENVTKSGSIIYSRPNQKVLREIFRFIR